VDGHGQSRFGRVRYIEKPLANPWVTTPVFDYVRGRYAFDPGGVSATHTRAVLFVKPDYFVVLDTVDGKGEHDYRMKYQLHQSLTAVANGVQVVGSTGNGPGIVVSPSRDDLTLSIIKGQNEPFKEGWHLLHEERAEAAPALIYEWRERAPAMVETVIWPTPPGGHPEVRVERSVAETTVILTVTRADDTDVIARDQAGNVTLRRLRKGKVIAAGLVGTAGLRGRGITMTAARAGSAYVMRDGDRYVTASNCEAHVAIPAAEVHVVEWIGR